MARYRLSRIAEQDLGDVLDYLGERSPIAAVHVLEALHETFVLLASSPSIGTLRNDLRPSLRSFLAKKPAGKYVVFYYPLPDGIEVATVLHASRDYLGMFARGER
jgi:toxin ParE1/3/4